MNRFLAQALRVPNLMLGLAGLRLTRNRPLCALPAQPEPVAPLPKNEPPCASEDDLKSLMAYSIQSKWAQTDLLDPLLLPGSTLSCLLCGHEAAHDDLEPLVSACIFLGGRLERYTCPHCGGVFGPVKMTRLTEKELDDEYKIHYKIFSEGDSTESEIKAFHVLDPKKEGIYLNFGCGAWSKTIEILRQEGWNVWGFEPNAASLHPFILSSEEQIKTMRFDGIFSNNVLEHLRFPIKTMQDLSTLLKDKGQIVHMTPCYSYSYEFTRFHLFFYTGRAAELLAEKSGFSLIGRQAFGELIAGIFQKL